MNHHLILDILLLLACSVVAVAIFRRLHIPAVLAYLLIGVVIGPYSLALIPDTEEIKLLAEVGVVFLLFTIGLEFSLPRVLAMWRVVFGIGGAQVGLTLAAAGSGALMLGYPLTFAIVVGGILAMSSTAIVIRQLTEQGELGQPHGQITVGILLLQDLAVVPFLILIPLIADAGSGAMAWPLLLAMIKGTIAFVLLLSIGHWLLGPIFHEIAAAKSAELFTLAVLLVALSAATITQLLGLSMALGGFLAGMVLSESKFRHQIEADIRPFRDVLIGLFFISVGMLINLSQLPSIIHWVLLLTLALLLLKGVVIVVIARAIGIELRVAVRVGLLLAQCGEFGFALLTLALDHALMQSAVGQVLLATVFLSMILAPLMIRYNRRLAETVVTLLGAPSQTSGNGREETIDNSLNNHIIICGYGRIGQIVGRMLEAEGFEFLALDMDPVRVDDAHTAGDRVYYGDSTNQEILRHAGVERARALVISYHDPVATHKVLQHTRELRPNMPVLVRTEDDSYLESYQTAGATEVVPETLEASLTLATHLLLLLNLPVSRVLRRVQKVRGSRYNLMRGLFHGESSRPKEGEYDTLERLHTITIPDGAHAVGMRLKELKLEALEIVVTAVRRGGIRGPEPDPDTTLLANDVLVLYGSPESLEKAEAQLLNG